MRLLNIDQLSLAELRYVAHLENFNDCENLTREELTELLEEYFDTDVNDFQVENDKKFVRSLTEVDSDVLQFPGVQPLPESFNTNEIHLILKDSNWAFVFWEIDDVTKSSLKERNAQIYLKLIALKESDKSEFSYEVGVELADTSWSVEIPMSGRTYKLELVAKIGTKEEILAVSEPERISDVYIQKNNSVLDDSEKYKLFTSSLVSKNGSWINNNKVTEIFNTYSESKK